MTVSRRSAVLQRGRPLADADRLRVLTQTVLIAQTSCRHACQLHLYGDQYTLFQQELEDAGQLLRYEYMGRAVLCVHNVYSTFIIRNFETFLFIGNLIFSVRCFLLINLIYFWRHSVVFVNFIGVITYLMECHIL